jgi:Major Facilitator Superfamily
MAAAQEKHSQMQAEAVSPSDSHGDMDEIQKYSTVNGDIGLQIFANRHVPAAAIDPKAERRLVRKIDMFIIPFICITYLITYIDKATLSYGLCHFALKSSCTLTVLLAAIFGLTKDAHLHGTQYSWLGESSRCSVSSESSLISRVGSIFYFGYMFVSYSELACHMQSLTFEQFEYPTSFAMQRVSVSRWLAGNVFLWGGICMALGGCNNFSALAALRFILGMLESCSTPAYLLLTAMWYKVEEQPIRIGYWSTFLGLANSFGGLLAYGIGNIHGAHLETWRYQFIIVGCISSVWGLIMYFFLAESPVTA